MSSFYLKSFNREIKWFKVWPLMSCHETQYFVNIIAKESWDISLKLLILIVIIKYIQFLKGLRALLIKFIDLLWSLCPKSSKIWSWVFFWFSVLNFISSKVWHYWILALVKKISRVLILWEHIKYLDSKAQHSCFFSSFTA